MARTVTFTLKEPQALESPIKQIESPVSGATVSETISCHYDYGTVSSIVLVECIVNKQDKTSTLMPSGATSGTGTSTITLKPLVIPSGYGGKRIVINVYSTVNGDTLGKSITYIVRKNEIE